MLTHLLLLAAVDGLDDNLIPDAQPNKQLGMGAREILLIVGVGVGIGLVLFLWVYLTYKRKRRHSLHSSPRLSQHIHRAEKHSDDDSPDRRVKVRRRRRRHPDNLPRNPTLGETGGLPPLRPDDPPAESAQP